jgi:hypothetical protein
MTTGIFRKIMQAKRKWIDGDTRIHLAFREGGTVIPALAMKGYFMPSIW